MKNEPTVRNKQDIENISTQLNNLLEYSLIK